MVSASWQGEILLAALSEDHARFERLHEEHVKSLSDLEGLLEFAALIFGMDREEMADAVAAFVQRKKTQ